MIRIAQQGRGRSAPAETLEEVVAGIGCHWVEVDGVRLTAAEHGLASAQFAATNGEFSVPTLVLSVIGPVEVVYLGADGEELGSEPFPDFAGQLDSGAAVRRGPTEP